MNNVFVLVRRLATILIIVGASAPVSAAEVANSFDYPIDDPTISFDFGQFDKSYFWGRHLGQDYPASPGTPVRAIANGRVRYSRNITGVGHAIHIEHTLPNGSRVVSVYYHLKRLGAGGIALSGDVQKGQVIGYVTGASEDYGTGPHLHFGVRKGGYRSGTDERTEKWFYPGYSSIFENGVRQKDENDPLHATIASEWEANPLQFIEDRRVPSVVRVSYSGVVTRVQDYTFGVANLFAGISVGDPVSIEVEYYPAEVNPRVISDAQTWYRFGSKSRIRTSIAGYSWASLDRANEFNLNIVNDFEQSFDWLLVETDSFDFDPSVNILQEYNGFFVYVIDYTGRLLSDTELPLYSTDIDLSGVAANDGTTLPDRTNDQEKCCIYGATFTSGAYDLGDGTLIPIGKNVWFEVRVRNFEFGY